MDVEFRDEGKRRAAADFERRKKVQAVAKILRRVALGTKQRGQPDSKGKFPRLSKQPFKTVPVDNIQYSLMMKPFGHSSRKGEGIAYPYRQPYPTISKRKPRTKKGLKVSPVVTENLGMSPLRASPLPTKGDLITKKFKARKGSGKYKKLLKMTLAQLMQTSTSQI